MMTAVLIQYARILIRLPVCNMSKRGMLDVVIVFPLSAEQALARRILT